ncbi:sigma-70 family RNA polymerase sigma factor [Planococcus sp. 1R117A]|uniref:sigma-70 family RNA polymerase sigma factor n=1 Tax=Planococcus sp. 1R117A TaxID=3447020 RepID=UPI003EDC79EB
MKLRDKELLREAQHDEHVMEELLQTEDAKKFIQYVIKSFTKRPALFMQHHKVEWEDLYQSCLFGLYNGIKKTDLNLDPNEWIRYLYLSIQGEIKSFSRSNDSNSMKISQRIRGLYPKYLVFHKKHFETHKKDPTIRETMDAFGISQEDAFDLVYGIQELLSLDQPYGHGEISQAMSNYVKDPIQSVEKNVITKVTVEAYFASITEVQKKVIYMYYFEGYNKTEIAKALGVSDVMIHKHIKKALVTIKNIA